MPHLLEDEYGLSAGELLDAVNERFRLKVALEGAVSEVKFETKLHALKNSGAITYYRQNDTDNYPDFSVWLSEGGPEIRIEVKKVRNAEDGYRRGGEIYAYKVEVQKTRRGEHESTRSYDVDHFEVLAVCVGPKTGDWEDFYFVKTDDLARHSKYADKLAAYHKVPLYDELTELPLFGPTLGAWRTDLKNLLIEVGENL